MARRLKRRGIQQTFEIVGACGESPNSSSDPEDQKYSLRSLFLDAPPPQVDHVDGHHHPLQLLHVGAQCCVQAVHEAHGRDVVPALPEHVAGNEQYGREGQAQCNQVALLGVDPQLQGHLQTDLGLHAQGHDQGGQQQGHPPHQAAGVDDHPGEHQHGHSMGVVVPVEGALGYLDLVDDEGEPCHLQHGQQHQQGLLPRGAPGPADLPLRLECASDCLIADHGGGKPGQRLMQGHKVDSEGPYFGPKKQHHDNKVGYIAPGSELAQQPDDSVGEAQPLQEHVEEGEGGQHQPLEEGRQVVEEGQGLGGGLEGLGQGRDVRPGVHDLGVKSQELLIICTGLTQLNKIQKQVGLQIGE